MSPRRLCGYVVVVVAIPCVTTVEVRRLYIYRCGHNILLWNEYQHI